MPSPKPSPPDPKTPPTPTTPRRNVTTTPLTPKSAPQRQAQRTRTTSKRAEPTLLGDFLLGRPSPQRTQRRKSLDLVKAEMKVAEVGRLQSPGGVKDRVKMWQRENAVVGVEDALSGVSAGGGQSNEAGHRMDDIIVTVEESAVGAGVKEGVPDTAAIPVRAGRSRSREQDKAERAARSKSAPRKRVVSDDHWRKKKSPPRRGKNGDKLTGGATLPRNFVQANLANPPLQSKIADWARRTTEESARDLEDSRQRKASRKVLTDDVVHDLACDSRKDKRSRPSLAVGDGNRVRASRSPSVEDGIRVKAMKEISADDGIRVKPARNTTADDGIRVRPLRDDRQRGELDDEVETQRSSRRTASHADTKSESWRRPRSQDGSGYDSASACSSPSPPQKSRTRQKKSNTPSNPVSDIPVGSSAFSVMEIPVGADAQTMRQTRLKPQRGPSFSAMPKVLKKVYNEGMKIVHDTVEPPRIRVNQPPSIESWLNGTTDPFVDRAGKDIVEKIVPSRRGGSSERGVTVEKPPEEETLMELASKQMRDAGANSFRDVTPLASEGCKEPPAVQPQLQGTTRCDPMGHTPSSPPATLKRSSATRNISSSPRSRKSPLKEALTNAFRGESTTDRPRNPSIRPYEVIGNDENCATPKIVLEDHDDRARRASLKRSPRMLDIASFDAPNDEDPTKSLGKQSVPKTGQHRLSTILSMASFDTSSSLTEPSVPSKHSNTTVIPAITPTDAIKSKLSNPQNNKSGLQRRLTKHSDLLSVLSFPDAGDQGRSRSIRSARSVRTTRSRLALATIPDLMQELATDEERYSRELKTLVDGIIPVLLTCVLSKSNSIVAAGLFNPSAKNNGDSSVTKPIVDMGIALERLKSLHRRIPLHDPDQLLTWANGAHKVYEDYLKAWRMGFQDVVVNLAPASRSTSSEGAPTLDGVPRNGESDVVDASGGRVDVAFLLKRPLVRIKYLAKTFKVRLPPTYSEKYTNTSSGHYSIETIRSRLSSCREVSDTGGSRAAASQRRSRTTRRSCCNQHRCQSCTRSEDLVSC